MTQRWTIGIIGGSGLYAIDAPEDAEWRLIDTPWSAPSDDILFGRIGNVALRFLSGHGRGHRIPPGKVSTAMIVGARKASSARSSRSRR